MNEKNPAYQESYTVGLTDLRFYAFHGVDPQEQRVGNDFSVTVKVKYIPHADMHEDRLENTISYADLYEIAKAEMMTTSKLLETVAFRIAERIIAKWPQIYEGSVNIVKINPPISGCTGQANVEYNFFQKK